MTYKARRLLKTDQQDPRNHHPRANGRTAKSIFTMSQRFINLAPLACSMPKGERFVFCLALLLTVFRTFKVRSKAKERVGNKASVQWM